MYGYRHQSNENGLMTNLNSISSSLSSIETVGRRNTAKSSIDNLISARNTNNIYGSHTNAKSINDRYSTNGSIKNGPSSIRGHYGHTAGSEIYYNTRHQALKCHCPTSETALNFLLVPLLLLTTARQVFDFLGQIWLQIIINFFTILILILAIFGIKQNRISYLLVFLLWTLTNIAWNLLVFCIYSKIVDVSVSEDLLSLYTGSTSWWRTNGPGCLPYNITTIQPSISVMKPSIITGCRLDHSLIEAVQAALHASLSFIAVIICFFVILSIRRNPAYFMRKPDSDKLYRLNNLTNTYHSKVNHDPSHNNSRFVTTSTNSLKRTPNKTSLRSSQHSVASNRSHRRRHRGSVDGALPRGSTSSAQRSQTYGSLSSRRSNRRDRRDNSSLTYGTTGSIRAGTSGQRTRLSSLSSTEYLPSYQPPHSSSANLLSSYGEISSIDSYAGNSKVGTRKYGNRLMSHGNTNLTYDGSRSSIGPSTNGNNNYDDISAYGSNGLKTNGSVYGVSKSSNDRFRQNGRTGSEIGNQIKPSAMPQEIQVETYSSNNRSTYQKGDTLTRPKVATNGCSFQSFSSNQNLHRMKPKDTLEINNNTIDNHDDGLRNGSSFGSSQNADSRAYQLANGSSMINAQTNQQAKQQIYAGQSGVRHPIYSNHSSRVDSETPI